MPCDERGKIETYMDEIDNKQDLNGHLVENKNAIVASCYPNANKIDYFYSC